MPFIRFAGHTAFALLSVCVTALAQSDRLSDYIRPLVGTQGEGNVFPGPSAPFGMIQLSPDTEDELWETASGYEYSDPTILGFSLTHLSGTGIPDLGDFRFMPQVGPVSLDPGREKNPDSGYRSALNHDKEIATAGYYSIELDNQVVVELTAGQRAGMLRMTFPESDEASILIDMSKVLSGGKWKVVWSSLRVEDDSTVTGFHLVNGWARERPIWFAARFSRPFDVAQIFSEGKEVKYDGYRFRSRKDAAGTDLRFVAKYKTTADEKILVKVSISGVSAANALANLDAEIPAWDFEGVRESTRKRWDDALANLQLLAGTQEEKETFYTALYHALLAPNLYEDVNGEYRGLDQNVHTADGFTNYTVFSLWDTYRATHPLLALIEPKRDADMILSMLAHYDQSVEKLLPIWSFHGNETWCMIGYHAVPVIADAYLKGVQGFDPERAYEAMKTTATNPNYDSVAVYEKLGWVPFDQENESVSKTLEYAYDDWTIAQMAKALGRDDDYARFMKRAGAYKNLFDPSIGLMRGKDSAGNWREPFDPLKYEEDYRHRDFTEGTSWQYTWYVPHDVPGLIALMGGREKFVEKLDQLFTMDDPNLSEEEKKSFGRMGEYWHGNEPAHHTVYLFSMAGRPWRAAELLRRIVTTQYGNKPESLTGNDDCGQMSAWYLFTCLGFYPVAPADDRYVIGAPQVKKAQMKLGSSGGTFTMTANGLSEENIYVQSVLLNGKPHNSVYLPFAAIKDGGTLEFTMGPKPSAWGTAEP